MASQDIISQLRDLQLAIDDFTDLNSSSHTTSSENYSGHSPSPTSTVVAHKDKILIEEKQTSLLDSVLPFQVEDDDFSSLMDQFAYIQQTTHGDDIGIPMEKTLLSPTYIDESKKDTMSTNPTPRPPKDIYGEKHWLPDDDTFYYRRPPPPPPPSDSPSTSSSIVSRATSSLSMNSKKSTRSYKSTKVKYRSLSSNAKRSTTTKYHARTYDEMMRIPDIHERIQFYDKTYQLCLRADSTLTTWINKTKSKGVPLPMLEGYAPPPRPIQSSTSYMSLGRSDSKYFKMNTSLSGSISMILRKANSTNPHALSTPKGMSRSFGQQQGLDKTHRMAHSMHWRQDQSPLPPTPAFSPAPSLRFKSCTHHMAPIPPRITPMTYPSAILSSSPSVGINLSSSSSSKKKKPSSRQNHQRVPSSIPTSPASSISLSASKNQHKHSGIGFDHMRTPSSSSTINLSMRRSKKQFGYSRGNDF